MRVEILKLDTTAATFKLDFEEYKNSFLNILEKSYPIYYGHEYQLKRIIDGQSILYLAFADKSLVGASYIKRNLRRGSTAVYPESYRHHGIAQKLVQVSLIEFPNQYTIINSENIKMLALMHKMNFIKAKSINEIQEVVKEEFSQLYDFEFSNGYLVFKRLSVTRETMREKLTLLHTFNNV